MQTFKVVGPIAVRLEFVFTLEDLEDIAFLRWKAIGQEAWPNFHDAPKLPYFRYANLVYLMENTDDQLCELIERAGGLNHLQVVGSTEDETGCFGHVLVVVPGAERIVYWRSNSGKSELRTLPLRYSTTDATWFQFKGTMLAYWRLNLPLFDIE